MDKEQIESFWQDFLKSLPEKDRGKTFYEAFGFGDSPELADKLLKLVLEGTKTATSTLLWTLEAENKELWKVGDLHIVLDGRDRPRCVIETTKLAIRPFKEVDEAVAFDYGEGNRTLKWWQKEMWEYY